MDFGIGFLSNKAKCRRSRFFYGIVDYGLAIIALTLVIRFALYRVFDSQYACAREDTFQPLVQAGKKFKSATKTTHEAAGRNGAVYKKFGNPLAGVFSSAGANAVLLPCFSHSSPFSDCKLHRQPAEFFPLHKLNKFSYWQKCHLLPKTSISALEFMFPYLIVPVTHRLTVGEKQNQISNQELPLQALVGRAPGNERSPLENNQSEKAGADSNPGLQPRRKQRFKEQDSPQIKDFCLLTLWEESGL